MGKFKFNDLVKCTFNKKETYGLIETCEREFMRRDTSHVKWERKYYVKVLETPRSQLKWEHELKKVMSFGRREDAVDHLKKMSARG